MKLTPFCITILASALAISGYAQTNTPSQTDFGGAGLIQVPSARIAQEGEFNFGGTFNDDYEHFFTSLSLFPWFETTIRYTRVPDMLYNPNYEYSGDNLYTDKGIDFKIRLFEESYWLPETAIGIRDFGGTGLFDGEFIAASKRVGNLDFTLGLGWGYLGQTGDISNPLCSVADSFCTRPTTYSGTGGSFDVQRWFHGNSAFFGGVEYQTPFEPLRLKLEYEGNDYSQDFPVVKVGKQLPQHTRWNVGLTYQLADWAQYRMSYERGDTLTLGFSLSTNFSTLSSPWRDDPIPTYQPVEQEDIDWDKLAQQIAHNAGYANASLSQDGRTLVVEGREVKYRNKEQAIERAATLLANQTGDQFDQYKIIDSRNGMAVTETTVDVKQYRQFANNDYPQAQLSDSTQTRSPNDYSAELLGANGNNWNAGIEPVLAQSLGGPESFYLYHLGFNTNANYWLTDTVEASGSVYFNLNDNYDRFNYVEDSPHISNFAVPRVRTLFRNYVHDNPIRLNRLQLSWFSHPSSDIYTQSYGGYLETMFAGVGGEVLYRPWQSSWAWGIDANLISQRNPDNWFDIYRDDYFYFDGYDASNCAIDSVHCKAYILNKGFTGHLTAYYMPQWSLVQDSLFKVSAGQFLGGDKGVRIDFSKQFKSGVIVGAYATITDLTADEYGEGSFNKGFYFNIPFDVMTVKPSINRAIIAWQPITRDGGQMLNKKYNLFDLTDGRSPWFER